MRIDSYAKCPCGSGKKFKFCCQPIVGDMKRVCGLQDSGQDLMAIQAAERVAEAHPEHPWPDVIRGMLLLKDGEVSEAETVFRSLVQRHPEHPLAIMVYAETQLQLEGFEIARLAVHRAFQHGRKLYPQMVVQLAAQVAGRMVREDYQMACRKHLELAARYASDNEARSRLFMQLLQFDGDKQRPFPFRGMHELAPIEKAGDEQTAVRKAFKLSEIGCWGPAARYFDQLIEHDETNAELWRNLGLCRAWDGDEIAGAIALHRAAGLFPDEEFERAVECETLAQLMDLNETDNVVEPGSREYAVDSVARLLTVLDDCPRLIRPERDADEDEESSAGFYLVLDRDPPQGCDGLGVDDVPRILAELEVFDYRAEDDLDEDAGDEEVVPTAYLAGPTVADVEAAAAVVEAAAGGLLVRRPEDEEIEAPYLLEPIPEDRRPLHWQWHVPETVKQLHSNKLVCDRWQQAVQEWLDHPLHALDGKSPRAAVGEASLRVKLAAAVWSLDVYCEQRETPVQIAEVREQLQVPAPQPFAFDAATSPATLSPMQFVRMPVVDVPDATFTPVAQRAGLIRYRPQARVVLAAALDRPEIADDFDLEKLASNLVQIAFSYQQREEALQWVARGRELAKSGDDAFQAQLPWLIREISFRAVDPDDPRTAVLLSEIEQTYFKKIPEVKPVVEGILKALDVEPPWGSGELVTAGATADAGVWTPETESSQPSAGGKLWLPGDGGG